MSPGGDRCQWDEVRAQGLLNSGYKFPFQGYSCCETGLGRWYGQGRSIRRVADRARIEVDDMTPFYRKAIN